MGAVVSGYSCLQLEGINWLEGGSKQIPGERHCLHNAQMSSPSHFGSLLIESAQM